MSPLPSGAFNVEPLLKTGHAYATIRMGPANPVDYIHGIPRWKPADETSAPAHGDGTGAEGSGLHAAALGGFAMEAIRVGKRRSRPEDRPAHDGLECRKRRFPGSIPVRPYH